VIVLVCPLEASRHIPVVASFPRGKEFGELSLRGIFSVIFRIAAARHINAKLDSPTYPRLALMLFFGVSLYRRDKLGDQIFDCRWLLGRLSRWTRLAAFNLVGPIPCSKERCPCFGSYNLIVIVDIKTMYDPVAKGSKDWLRICAVASLAEDFRQLRKAATMARNRVPCLKVCLRVKKPS
jgi:hypothetical protein